MKLGASERGAGLGLVGATDTTAVLLQADGAEAVQKLTSESGRQQLVKP